MPFFLSPTQQSHPAHFCSSLSRLGGKGAVCQASLWVGLLAHVVACRLVRMEEPESCILSKIVLNTV